MRQLTCIQETFPLAYVNELVLFIEEDEN